MGTQAFQHCMLQLLACGFYSAVQSPMPANTRHRNCVLNLTSFLRSEPKKMLWQGTLFHVGTHVPVASILREENLQKTLGVISFFRKNSIWGPPPGYGEWGGIPWSSVCESGVLSFMSIQRPTSSHPSGDCHIQQEPGCSTAAAPPSLLLERGQCKAVLRSGEDGKPQCLLGRGGALSLHFIWKCI